MPSTALVIVEIVLSAVGTVASLHRKPAPAPSIIVTDVADDRRISIQINCPAPYVVQIPVVSEGLTVAQRVTLAYHAKCARPKAMKK
jgi:hypothetical protein